jgi:hypothetical protein
MLLQYMDNLVLAPAPSAVWTSPHPPPPRGAPRSSSSTDFVDKDFGGTTGYGDTDSCFMTFPKLCVDEAGNKLKGKAAVAKCIELTE